MTAYILRFTVLILFLCDCVKAHVYTDELTLIDALEDNIEAYNWEIPAEIFERVCQNWVYQTYRDYL